MVRTSDDSIAWAPEIDRLRADPAGAPRSSIGRARPGRGAPPRRLGQVIERVAVTSSAS